MMQAGLMDRAPLNQRTKAMPGWLPNAWIAHGSLNKGPRGEAAAVSKDGFSNREEREELQEEKGGRAVRGV